MKFDDKPAPEDIDVCLRQAVSLLQAGHLAEAERLAQEVLRTIPEHPGACQLNGIIALRNGQFELAGKLIGIAVRSDPGQPVYHFNLGVVMQRKGDLDAAVAAYERAVQLNPGFLEAQYNYGDVLRDLGRLEEALQAYEGAIRINPALAAAHNSRGVVLRYLGRMEESLRACEEAIRLAPDFADAYINRGSTLRDLGRNVPALADFDHAVALHPGSHEAHNNRAVVLLETGRLGEALAACEAAIGLNPSFADTYNVKGNVLLNLCRAEEAEDCFRRALELNPEYDKAHSNLLFLLAAYASLSPAELLEEGARWERLHGRQGRNHPKPVHQRDAAEGRRLRVGYISPDFRTHAVSYFFEPLLASHDKSRYEIFCFDNNAGKPDETTARLCGIAEHWDRVAGKSDAELAALIHGYGIDILVDLAGHTAGNRLKVFTYRPAPVQATYLGFFASSGLESVDYWITDRVLHPPDTVEKATEKIYRLPHCAFCYRPPTDAPEVSSCPGVDERVVFGSFSHMSKLTPDVIATWSELLHKLPDSRLLIMEKSLGDSYVRGTLLERFSQHNISAGRLLFHGGRELREYLSMYAMVDIALDPFPRTGGTTTAEALWMGVPVVTLAGQRYAERISASKLVAAGLEDLIAQSRDEYIRIAVSLAGDPQKRTELRKGLRERMQESRLCDNAGLARDMEAAYREMWDVYNSG